MPDSIKTAVAADSQIGWTWTELCETVGANAYFNRSTRTVVQISPRIYTMKYIDRTALTKSQNETNPIILRYADVLLVFAEAQNEVSGPTAAAYDAINQVRTRSNVPNLTLGLSQAQFRDSVWLERRHELYGEFQEWFDLMPGDDEIFRLFEEYRVPYAPVLNIEQAIAHPHLRRLSYD